MFRYYFGSKTRLAATYQAPRHDVIVEPFAGAAAYSVFWLRERRDLRAVLIDSDWLVVDMWERLLAMSPADLWNYPLPIQGERVTDPLYLCGAVSSGSWGACHAGRSYQITEMMAGAFPATRQIMAETLSLIKGRVEVTRGDYRVAPMNPATWFIDPPYQSDGEWYASGNDLDFGGLGEWVQGLPGQVIVCESQGADWLPFDPHRITNTIRNTESVEVVWYSDPEPTLFT